VRVKGPVTLQLREAATVFVCFAGGGRDGGLTPMLLANGVRVCVCVYVCVCVCARARARMRMCLCARVHV